MAAELLRCGREAVACTGGKYRYPFTSLSATRLPWTPATDYDDADLTATSRGPATAVTPLPLTSRHLPPASSFVW